MISVSEALAALFDLVEPLESEDVPLREASGRVLARPVAARRDQPPFASSAMDGYAVIAQDARPGATLEVVGEAAAGQAWNGTLAPGQAVRIFTGAPVPAAANRVIIQEDVTVQDGCIILTDRLDTGLHIRPIGADFTKGSTFDAPRRLGPSDVALLAAMNVAQVPVTRRPEIAIIATGNELVQPGETPGPDQIIASNSYGLAALLQEAGAHIRLLPIARDTVEDIQAVLRLAEGADLILTIGGASVGDHDLVAPAAEGLGLSRAFYKVAMRPGKPLMAGRLASAALIGLPGNPVSAMVCGTVFLLPVLRKMLGLKAQPLAHHRGRLAIELPQNGPREHYMRAQNGANGITPFASQDSALLSVLSQANCLLVRPPNDPARTVGEMVDFIQL